MQPSLRLIAALASVTVCLSACERKAPPESSEVHKSDAVLATTIASASQIPSAAAASDATASPTVADADAGTAEVPQPHKGPWFTVLAASAAIYAKPNSDKDSKLGYAQSGARLAATTNKAKSTESCQSGWVELVGKGFICSANGTLDDNDSRLRLTQRAPDLDALLPYKYARNAKNGTPMYRTVPTREDIKRYEPYLAAEAAESGHSSTASRGAPDAGTPPADATGASSSQPLAQNPAPVPSNLIQPAPEENDKRPWWQRQGAEDKLNELTLADLRSDSDDVLAQRMVKGFYVAVDRIFRWNGRTWYKTTKRMVVPADRFGLASASDFKGVELGSDWQLPVAWTYGPAESVPLYEEDAKKHLRPAGKLKHFDAVQLTGETKDVGETSYLGVAGGKWVKKSQVRMTAPGSAPSDLKPNEHWIDINLTQQTLVAFEGARPVFATMVSTGKFSRNKDKDHSTPLGAWRVREKHLTTTMDGDGTAAGDLPYSIEDVPFVMYFHKSYALHGAFWHRNFGVQMSHGCINLAPLDAKRLFFFAAPESPAGWHGLWSSATYPGSWVVVHD